MTDKRRILLDLPWPPSINHYYVRGRGGPRLSKRAIAYRKEVWVIVYQQKCRWHSKSELTVCIELYGPSNVSRYDCDNFNKAIFDALQDAGVFVDDKQITTLLVEKKQRLATGKALVLIQEM